MIQLRVSYPRTSRRRNEANGGEDGLVCKRVDFLGVSTREGGPRHVGQEDNEVTCDRVYRGGGGSYPRPRKHEQAHTLVRKVHRQPSLYALGRTNTHSFGYLAGFQAVPRGPTSAAVVPPLFWRLGSHTCCYLSVVRVLLVPKAGGELPLCTELPRETVRKASEMPGA